MNFKSLSLLSKLDIKDNVANVGNLEGQLIAISTLILKPALGSYATTNDLSISGKSSSKLEGSLRDS